jgi:hypothetical protein
VRPHVRNRTQELWERSGGPRLCSPCLCCLPAEASILALEMTGLPYRLAPQNSLIMVEGSLEVMVYKAGALNATASSSGPRSPRLRTSLTAFP